MNPASNLVLVGPMGAGKSAIGRRLAERFALPFVDADREIELRTGTSVATIFACEGEEGFRVREREVLVGLVEGGTNKIIGQKLGISPRTVELHRSQVMSRLNVSSLTELLQVALAAGITPAPNGANHSREPT